MIRALVVDDEPLAREELSRLIRQDKDFEIVGEAASGAETLEKLKKKKMDVVFLDIEMPGLSGLEVASQLAAWREPPLVVFATAFEKYAIEAFEANALDYILKPYDPARLQKTFARVKELLKAKAPSREKLVSLEDYLIRKGALKKLAGHRRNSKERVVINPEDAYYFYTEYTEVRARLGEGELILNSTLKELLQNLDSARFVQTHKSYLVNVDKVEKVSPLFSRNYEIILKGPNLPKIPLSRRFAKSLKRLLGSW